MRHKTLLVFSSFLFVVCFASAASTPWQTNEHGQVRLIVPYDVLPSSGSVTIGLHFKTIPNWHVYWKNPGDAGIPPKLDWTGSTGFKVREFLWPNPSRFHLPGDLTAIGYTGEVVYPIQIQLTENEPFHLKAKLDYLTCDEQCVPYRMFFVLDVPKGSSKVDLASQQLIDRYLAQVPKSDSDILIQDVPAQGASHPPLSVSLLLIGFLGGLLLNIMPCVLPVLSIKLIGLVEQSGMPSKQIRIHSLLSTLGILISFWLIATGAVLAQQAGQTVGWGIQFQNPVFVGFLAIILLMFALNLWGIFEIPLPRWAQSAVEFEQQSKGYIASFVSGLFATLLATPCSAPFLGTAVGFGLSTTATNLFVMFTVIGLGLAFPYVAIAIWPPALRWLPRPGAWMGHLKMVFGFLLAATLIWLLYVLSQQVTPVQTAIFQLVLLGLAFFVWAYSIVLQSPWKLRSLATGVIFLLAAALTGAGLNQLSIPHSQPLSEGERLAEGRVRASDDSSWIPFNEASIPGYLEQGKTVFVDVTAEWCFTCKANEKAILNTQTIQSAFKERGVIAMKADWTNRNETIATYLKKFNRYGIPCYVVYKPNQEPIVLPEVITKRMVLEAIQ